MPEDLKHLTTAEWSSAVLAASKPVAVDFWHEKCVWCNRLDPHFASVAAARSSEMSFYKLHVFREPEITERYGVQGTPTIKFFCGGREIDEIVGYRPKAELLREVDRILASSADCLRSSTPVKEG